MTKPTPEDLERARKIAGTCWHFVKDSSAITSELAQALAEAREQGRRQGIEAAADLVEVELRQVHGKVLSLRTF